MPAPELAVDLAARRVVLDLVDLVVLHALHEGAERERRARRGRGRRGLPDEEDGDDQPDDDVGHPARTRRRLRPASTAIARRTFGRTPLVFGAWAHALLRSDRWLCSTFACRSRTPWYGDRVSVPAPGLPMDAQSAAIPSLASL